MGAFGTAKERELTIEEYAQNLNNKYANREERLLVEELLEEDNPEADAHEPYKERKENEQTRKE